MILDSGEERDIATLPFACCQLANPAEKNRFLPAHVSNMMNKRGIDAKTVVCAVIGDPIEHSLSPLIHNAAFSARNLNWVYVACRVTDLKHAIAGIRALGIRGVSVTLPHKIAALPLLDEIDAPARSIGSINTIVNTDGRLIGYNSDGDGALQALRDAGYDPSGKNIALLGSGGAARAIVMTLVLKSPPAKLTILGAIHEEVQGLARDSSHIQCGIVVGDLLTAETLSRALDQCDILIHATPVGMYPHSEQSLVPSRLLRSDLVVFDIVYNPMKTRLLSDAERAGCVIISGIEMFINQAAVQFRLWTGEEAPRDVMRSALQNALLSA